MTVIRRAASPLRSAGAAQQYLRQRTLMCRSRRHVRFFMLGAALYALAAAVPDGYAQVTTAITPDGTLGSTATRSGNVVNISGGTIRGTNQFHSFGQFSVGTGDTASFNGPANATIQ